MNEFIRWPHKDRDDPIVIGDADGEHITVTFGGDTSFEDGPLFSIDGTMTLAQLHRITHALTMAMVEGDLSAQTAATWARDEALGKLVTLGADDDR